MAKGTSSYKCGNREDGSKNVFPPLTADQNGHIVENHDLKVDNVVLVILPHSPRGQWPLGRVIEVYPGQDSHNHVAKVVCGAKTVVGPITKLIPLGIN